ncbi:MAG: NADH-quinone oxidoreductase subunit M, partial [Actinobacteria bacterium]|nr:NADH-quinone oxidoreductase subunit M [Actinomycetota bacterium]
MSTGEAALDFPWLSLSLWLPLALGLPPLLLARHRHVVGAAATVATATQAVLAIIIVAKFNHSINDYQLIEEAQWLPALGISYKLGVDGVSILLVLLTGILGPIVAVTSWLTVKRRVNEFFAALIILQTGMLGVFVALDFVLFYVFWELVLIPMYLIIGVWGGERRIYATVKFFLYTFAGSVLMLVAILAIRFYAGTFDITQLPATMAQAPLDLQRWV